MTFDDARLLHPGVGFALYALDPHGPVTLEAHTPDGAVMTWRAETEEAALAIAFPPAPAAEPETEEDVFA